MEEKIFNILAIIFCSLMLIIITFFVISFIRLNNFKKCSKIDFNSTYCEKYKDF